MLDWCLRWSAWNVKLCYDRRSVVQSVLVWSPIWGPVPEFCYYQRIEGLLMWGTLSDETTRVSFTVADGPRQRSHSRVWVPRGSWPYFLLSQETAPTWRGRSPYLYPAETWWPSYTPRHWVPFSSSPTTRRATVEVFERASTWAWRLKTEFLPNNI
jgi:hypothetical protein